MPEIEYVWDELSDNVIEEYEDGVLAVSYDHEPGLYGNLLSKNRSGVTSYYHYDGRGDTVALTDDSGNVTDTKEYDAWGNVIASTGSSMTPYQFVGRQGYQTGNTGVYVRARMYQPTVARWSSVDPAFMYPNAWAFGYADSDPISIVDSSGLAWIKESRNIYRADDAGHTVNTLQSLALQMTGNIKDWVCIWPIPDDELWSHYPAAHPCARANVKNLLADNMDELWAAARFVQGEDGYLGAVRVLFRNRPGFIWNNGEEAANKFKSSSGEGKTPLSKLMLAGHNYGDAKICAKGPAGCFDADNVFAVATEKNNASNSYRHAIAEIGPPRCWLQLDAVVYGIACTSSAAWAPDWASRIVREGEMSRIVHRETVIKSAPSLIFGEWRGDNARVWFTDFENDKYSTAGSFLSSKHWDNTPGGA